MIGLDVLSIVVSSKEKGEETTHSALSATSSPLSPIRYITSLLGPGTCVVGWISAPAPVPPDDLHEVTCPAGGRVDGTHTSSEGFLIFRWPFDRRPDSPSVPEPTACWTDSTEKESGKLLIYCLRSSIGLYSRTGMRGGGK